MVRVSCLLAAACIFSSAAFAFSPSFPYGSTKVRGVSLGGWLVLEVSTRHHSSLCQCGLTRTYSNTALDYPKHIRQHWKRGHRRRVDVWGVAGQKHGVPGAPKPLEHMDNRRGLSSYCSCWVRRISFFPSSVLGADRLFFFLKTG